MRTQALHLGSIEPITEPPVGGIVVGGGMPQLGIGYETLKHQQPNPHVDPRPSCHRWPAVLCPDPSQNKNPASATA